MCSPRYTTPIPPRPTISCSLYLPTVVPARASAAITLALGTSRGTFTFKHAFPICLFLVFFRRVTRGPRHHTVRAHVHWRAACEFGVCSPHATRRTPTRRTATHHDHARLQPLRGGLRADRVRRDPGDLHGLGRGEGARVHRGAGARLGDGRIRDAAAFHAHALVARRRWTRPGDPAPDRPVAARRDRRQGDGAATDHHRLRRHP